MLSTRCVCGGGSGSVCLALVPVIGLRSTDSVYHLSLVDYRTLGDAQESAMGGGSPRPSGHQLSL